MQWGGVYPSLSCRCHFDATRRGMPLPFVSLPFQRDKEGHASPLSCLYHFDATRRGMPLPVVSLPFWDEEGHAPSSSCLVSVITAPSSFTEGILLNHPSNRRWKGIPSHHHPSLVETRDAGGVPAHGRGICPNTTLPRRHARWNKHRCFLGGISYFNKTKRAPYSMKWGTPLLRLWDLFTVPLILHQLYI